MLVYLHIGTPKSGTTYLQEICTLNREVLADRGVLWPGRRWDEQVRAIRDVLSFSPGGESSTLDRGGWAWLRDQIAGWRGRAVLVSMEWLVHATPAQVEVIVGSLRPHEVRVVVTARDIARTVPAQWQEQMQNWATWTWEEYLSAVTSEHPLEHDAGRQFYTDHDLGRILRTWSEQVPAEHITLVTVPGREAPRDLLWRRFAEAISVDTAAIDTAVPFANASLGAASAELMRRINVASREAGLSWRVGDPMLKWALAKGVLSERRDDEPRLTLPPEHHDWAARESRRLIGDVQAAGVPVVGSLVELMPAPADLTDPAGPVSVTADQMLAAAVDGIAGLTMLVGAVATVGSTGSEVLQVENYVAEVQRRQALEEARAAAAEPLAALAAQEPGATPERARSRARAQGAAPRARTAAAWLRSRGRVTDRGRTDADR